MFTVPSIDWDGVFDSLPAADTVAGSWLIVVSVVLGVIFVCLGMRLFMPVKNNYASSSQTDITYKGVEAENAPATQIV